MYEQHTLWVYHAGSSKQFMLQQAILIVNANLADVSLGISCTLVADEDSAVNTSDLLPVPLRFAAICAEPRCAFPIKLAEEPHRTYLPGGYLQLQWNIYIPARSGVLAFFSAPYANLQVGGDNEVERLPFGRLATRLAHLDPTRFILEYSLRNEGSMTMHDVSLRVFLPHSTLRNESEEERLYYVTEWNAADVESVIPDVMAYAGSLQIERGILFTARLASLEAGAEWRVPIQVRVVPTGVRGTVWPFVYLTYSVPGPLADAVPVEVIVPVGVTLNRAGGEFHCIVRFPDRSAFTFPPK